MTENEKPTEDQTVKDKLCDTIKHLGDNETVAELRTYTQSHKCETIVGSLLILGLLVALFHPIGFWLVGFVAGYFFYDEIIQTCRNMKSCCKQMPPFKVIIYGSTLFAVFWGVPQLVIGAIISTIVRWLLNMKCKKEGEEK